MKRRGVSFIGLYLLILTTVLVPMQPVHAATLTAGNALELIGEISIANGTAGADTIILTNNITLTTIIDSGLGNTGLPVITSDITIEGQGHTLTRGVGAPAFRIFRVGAGGNLKLNNLVISNGNGADGGGAYNAGTLTINHSAFSDNSASSDGGGVYNNGGSLTITNSTFSGNSVGNGQGGGVFNDFGSTTITNSTFSGNSAGGGGGVFNSGGTLTINHSTFSGNSANGGGVYNLNGGTTITNSTFSGNSAVSSGGGVYNTGGGTLTITNSTFSGNSAGGGGGGGISNRDALTIISSTFSGNSSSGGGGVFNDGGTTTITNSIIANSPSGGNCLAFGPFPIAGSFSLATDDTCSGFTNSADINLAPLADNGGSTRTFALNPSSLALDVANSTNCTASPVNGTDQRGINRGVDGDAIPDFPQPGDCDIGAFELGGTIRTLQFASSSSAITPGSVTTLPIPLTLDGFVFSGYAPIIAYIWVSGGTAVAGTDYAPFGVQTVTFTSDPIEPVTLNLLNSGLTADRTIVLSFATTHGPGFSGAAQLGTRTSHTITLKASAPGAAPVRYYYGTRVIPLRWARVSWATGYEIQVDNESTFAAPRILDDNLIPQGTLAYDVNVPGDGTYYWRVWAKKPDGTFGGYSPTQSFVVAGT